MDIACQGHANYINHCFSAPYNEQHVFGPVSPYKKENNAAKENRHAGTKMSTDLAYSAERMIPGPI